MIRYAMHARDYTHHHMQQSLHAHATTHTTTSPLSFPLVSSLVCFAFVRAHCVQAASRFIGMEGLLVTDDRDGLPFGVQFVPGETRAGAFYSMEELLPVGAAEGGEVDGRVTLFKSVLETHFTTSLGGGGYPMETSYHPFHPVPKRKNAGNV